MNIFVGSLFPKIYDNFLGASIIGKAIETGKISIEIIDMLKIAGKERVDAPTVGHGPGMLIRAEVIERLVENVIDKTSGKKPFTIFFSPHGKTINQKHIFEIKNKIFENKSDLLLIASRYEGCDVRAEEEYADEILSIGNYVLMGGDLPAMVFLEALTRLIPSIVKNNESLVQESFSDCLVDSEHYANPDIWKDKKIPDVLKSGNHKLIANWRKRNALERTFFNGHFSWWRSCNLSDIDINDAKSVIPSHYCILLHNDVMSPDGKEIESSVTSTDIHDIARSAATYGIVKYYIVTRVDAQQKLVKNFLNFWKTETGTEINKTRTFSLRNVECFSELDDALNDIKSLENKDPICIVTSARKEVCHENFINYNDQSKIWKKQRPVVFIFGTSHGISNRIMKNMEYRLIPLFGMQNFNFLSVRTAAGIIFDRWFGLNPV